jgi:LuxR family maltose regulon positive regulatory protein
MAVQALLALHFNSCGKEKKALEALESAVRQSELGGAVRCFIDLGPEMERLLFRLMHRNKASPYTRRVLDAFDHWDDSPPPVGAVQGPPTRPQQPEDPLTRRELEILALLAQRLRNKEIAEKLFISPATVKRHTINIYGKLGVNSRQSAVARARDIGILQEIS